MSTANTVQVTVVGGPTVVVPWFKGMNAQQALEGAYDQINNTTQFTYALQYHGSKLGYFVNMINETCGFIHFIDRAIFLLEFLLNGSPSSAGIDSVALKKGDAVSFSFEMFDPVKHAKSTLREKQAHQVKSTKKGK